MTRTPRQPNTLSSQTAASPLRRRTLLAGAAAGLFALATPSVASAATVVGRQTFAALRLNTRPTYLATPTAEVYSDRPVVVGGTARFRVPAVAGVDLAGTRRRSEGVLSTSMARPAVPVGSTVAWSGTLTATLGPAAANGRDWHILHQLHGTHGGGTWGLPALALVVVSGRLVLRTWAQETLDLGAWRDGVPVALRIRTTVHPTRGAVLVTVGTRPAVTWRPVRGTCYPDQDFVDARVGLYRGSGSGAHPTVDQVVSWADLAYAVG